MRPLDDPGNSWIGGTFGALWRSVRRFGDAIATAQLGRGLAQVLGQVAGAFCRRLMTLVLVWMWRKVMLMRDIGGGFGGVGFCGADAVVRRWDKVVFVVVVENRFVHRLRIRMLEVVVVVQAAAICF